MGKRSCSSTEPSAEQLLDSAASLISTKPGKSNIKNLFCSTIPSSDLVSSLPATLQLAVLHALKAFNQTLKPVSAVDAAAAGVTKLTPPPSQTKIRRSSRLKRSDGPGGDTVPSIPRLKTLDIQNKLRAYAYIAHICVSHPKKLFYPSDLLHSVQFLHDHMLLYKDPALLSEVATLCEVWWKDNLPGRETLITQSLPFLLSKSLTHGKKADVYRIYALREAFTFFDYEDESIEDLRLLLVRCVITPVYVKTKEGRSFISFVAKLNNLLLKEVLALIRSQIPYGKKSVLEGYADIIYKAWKGSGDSVKEEIENGFLQGLMEGAIHAQTKPFAESIRRVLNGFIGQRTTPGVDKVLFRLAEPVLFRSLQVANSNVRQNALFLLIDLFPLEDPDVTKDVKDTLFEKQFFLLQKLLMDDCPDIRGVAVQGLCRILNLFWEVIPSLTITKLLGKVIDDMTCDICNEVRLAALNGIIYLLENPQSHEIMKILLPKLSCMMSDPSLSVRIAVTDLLLEVGHIRPFQFSKVVSLDSLFSSLANDHERVARKITKLLIPSYFPSNLEPMEACSRFGALMRRCPFAGARFCEFALSEGSSSKSLMELLEFCIDQSLAESGQSSDLIDGLIIASAHLCSYIAAELSNKSLGELFSADRVKMLLNAATSSGALAAVLSIASIVSPTDLHDLRDQCLFLVLECVDLSGDLERQGLVRKIHKLFFSCGWLGELIGILSSNLQSISSRFLSKFELDVPSPVLRSIKKKIRLPVKTSHRFGNFKESAQSGKSKTEKDLCLAAGISWQLKDIVTDVDMRKALFQSPHCNVAFHSLKIISQVSIQMCARYEFFDPSSIVSLATLAVYLSLQKDYSIMNEALKSDVESESWCLDSNVKCTVLRNALSNLLHCAEKMFIKASFVEYATPLSGIKHDTAIPKKSRRKAAAAASASNRTDGCDFKHDAPKAKGIVNVMKMCTSILKLIDDTKTMNLVGDNDVTCLRFVLGYVRYVLSSMGGYRHEASFFKEDDLKEAFYYLRSSFTYAAKLLHLVLLHSNEFSTVPIEAFYLSNDLLDLITAIEPYFGTKLSLQMVSVVKPWLPVVIVGVGCNQLIKPRKQEGDSKLAEPSHHHFPTWLAVLSKAELHEISNVSSANENSDEISEPEEASVFTKLISMVVVMLKKGSLRIMDAIGCVMLVGLNVGLETRDFSLLLGLVHFICMKLLGQEFTSWNELEQMISSLQEIYPRIENEIANPSLTEDERIKLETAKTLLTSLCLNRG